MKIMMTDTSVKRLIKRAEEKLSQGYDVMVKIQRDQQSGVVKEMLPKWKMVMVKA